MSSSTAFEEIKFIPSQMLLNVYHRTKLFLTANQRWPVQNIKQRRKHFFFFFFFFFF